MMGGVYMLLRPLTRRRTTTCSPSGISWATSYRRLCATTSSTTCGLSFGYYSDTKVGQIMARITSDLFEITEVCASLSGEFLIAGGLRLAQEVGDVATKRSYTLVVVAGMNYAVHVESKGRDVLYPYQPRNKPKN